MKLDSEIGKMVRRYRAELRDMDRKIRDLPAREQALARTHANVKQACANELQRLLDEHACRGSERG